MMTENGTRNGLKKARGWLVQWPWPKRRLEYPLRHILEVCGRFFWYQASKLREMKAQSMDTEQHVEDEAGMAES